MTRGNKRSKEGKKKINVSIFNLGPMSSHFKKIQNNECYCFHLLYLTRFFSPNFSVSNLVRSTDSDSHLIKTISRDKKTHSVLKCDRML